MPMSGFTEFHHSTVFKTTHHSWLVWFPVSVPHSIACKTSSYVRKHLCQHVLLFSVILTACRGPGALSIYSTHGTPSFMPHYGFKKRNSGCILPLSYACFELSAPSVNMFVQKSNLYVKGQNQFGRISLGVEKVDFVVC